MDACARAWTANRIGHVIERFLCTFLEYGVIFLLCDLGRTGQGIMDGGVGPLQWLDGAHSFGGKLSATQKSRTVLCWRNRSSDWASIAGQVLIHALAYDRSGTKPSAPASMWQDGQWMPTRTCTRGRLLNETVECNRNWTWHECT